MTLHDYLGCGQTQLCGLSKQAQQDFVTLESRRVCECECIWGALYGIINKTKCKFF